MSKEHLLALDQGASSSRAIVFHRSGRIVACAQREFTQCFPQPGWVEHDAEETWDTRPAQAREALAASGLRAADIAAIGNTNPRETTALLGRQSSARCTAPSSGRTAAPNPSAPSCGPRMARWSLCAPTPAC
jgi:glycerol kinase